MNTKVQSFLLALVFLSSMFSDSDGYFPAGVGRRSSIQVSIFISKRKQKQEQNLALISGIVKLKTFLKWFLCFRRCPTSADYFWNKILKFHKKWKKFFFCPWQEADASEDSFLAARVTWEVSDNLVEYDYISWLALWCYVGSSTIVAGFKLEGRFSSPPRLKSQVPGAT